MSVLPISRNRPPGFINRNDASTNSPVKASSTTSTPPAGRNLSSNSKVRDDASRSAATPESRTTCHLPALAVAKTSAPR
jgi:hypothetical protein